MMPGFAVQEHSVIKITNENNFRIHSHSDFELVCVFEGQYRMISSGVSYELMKPQKTITEVGLECGFMSLRTFNRVFKREVGMTPSEFRHELFGNGRHPTLDSEWT